MANSVELATAYVSLVGDTRKLVKDINSAFDGYDGRPAGRKIVASVSQGMTGGNSAIARAGADAAAVYERNLQASIRGERIGTAIGTVIGKGIGAGIRVGIAGAAAAATGAVALLSTTLTKGFRRLQTIDQAKFKLQALGNSAEAVQQIMDSANKSVKGTAFSLADAATASAAAVAAGVKPGEKLTKYLTEVADSAAVAGTSFEEMGSIFNKIQTNNKAYTDDLQQLADRGLPIFTWLREEYGVTAEALQKMVEDGKVSAEDFQKAIDQHISGAAQKMGQSFSGSVENMEAAMARLGANFLTAIFGGDSVNALSGPTEAVNKITEKFNQLDQWVQAHQGDIKNFFQSMSESAKWVVEKLRQITEYLTQHPDLVKNVVVAFAAWKTIEGVSALVTSLKTVSTLLGVTIPASAASGAAAAGAAWAPLIAALKTLPLYGVGLQSDVKNPTDIGLPETHVNPDGSLGFGKYSLNNDPSVNRRGVPQKGPFPETGGTRVTPDNILNPPSFGGGAASPGGAASAAPAGLTGNKGVVYSAMLQAGFPASEWGALQNLLMGESGFQNNIKNPSSTAYGMFQFLDSTWATVGGSKTSDPMLQAQYGLQYIRQRYGSPSAAWAFWQSQSPHWYAGGGAAMGPGGPKSDMIPAMLSNGEHVWTAAEVNAVGGQANMYLLRSMALAGMIPGFDNGGAVMPLADLGRLYDPRSDPRNNPYPSPSDQGGQAGNPWPTKDLPPGYKKGYEYASPGIGNTIWTIQGQEGLIGSGKRRGFTKKRPRQKRDLTDPFWQNRQGVWGAGYAEGGAVTLEDLLKQGVDPNTTQHGTGMGAAPGPTPEQLQQLGQVLGGPQDSTQSDAPDRTQGYIPAAAGSTSVAGTSFLSGIYGMGAEVINGIIDQAANAASQAAGAAATVFAPGSGGAASGLTSAAISMGTQAAKRGVEYGAQMLGIGTDALIEQLTPFGAPRILTTDVTGFMPQQAIMSAATTSIEKAFQQGNQPPGEGPQQHQGTGAPPGPPPAAPAEQQGPFGPVQPPLPGPPPPPQTPAPQPQDPNMIDPLQILTGGVYDSGGWLPPGGVAVNLGNKPEPVLSPSEWAQMTATSASPAQSGNVTYQVYAQDLGEAMRSLKNKERLQMMTHAGRP